MNDAAHPGLSNVIVYDADGAPHRLVSLWTNRPVVLALVRHLGCVFTRQQVFELRQRQDEIIAAGADLIVLAPSKPAQVRAFRARYAADLFLYADPDRLTFACLQLRRGVSHSMAFRDLSPLRAALRAGFRMGLVQGDAWQQGGVFVLGAGGKALFSHRNARAGDHCVLDAALAVLTGPAQQALAS